ncbi:MAG: rhomboid family intramembrane serine protease [Phycisphaerae bacterium]
MIPLRDNNPTATRPVVTIGLIVANAAVFLLAFWQPDHGERAVWTYGFLPATVSYSRDDVREALVKQAGPGVAMVTDARGRVHLVRRPNFAEAATSLPMIAKLFTCMFMHGGWMHLIGNMLYLWIFGNNIEDRLGGPLFLAFYLGTGIVGTLAHAFIDSANLTPMVGASGAISGVLGAYILLFPHAKVEALVPLGWYMTTVMLPAWVFLGIYAAMQLLYGLPQLSHTGGGGTAYWAHLGGFASGMLLIKLLPQQRRTRPIPIPAFDDAEDDDAFIRF